MRQFANLHRQRLGRTHRLDAEARGLGHDGRSLPWRVGLGDFRVSGRERHRLGLGRLPGGDVFAPLPRWRLGQLNITKAFPLPGDQLLEFAQLEHGQKRRDNFKPAPGRLEQFGETNRLALRQDLPDECDLLGDGPLIRDDLPCPVGALFFRLVEALEHLVDGVDQFEDRRGFRCLRRQRRHLGLGPLPVETLLPLPGHSLKVGGCILEFPVLDKLPDQIPAGILLLVLLGNHLLIDRKQFLALDVHERRGHDDKLPGQLEVELLHQVNVLAELVGQLDHVHLVDVDLLLANQVQ